MMRPTRLRGAYVVVAVMLVPAAWRAVAQGKVDIRVVSSRPDMVSGGDTLIEIKPEAVPRISRKRC